MAPVRFTRRLWLLPTQARPSLHDRWRRTWSKWHWHWPWNDKSTISKARSSLTQNEAGMLWENCWLPTTSHLHIFAMHSAFAVEIWAQMRQVTSTASKTSFASLLCQLRADYYSCFQDTQNHHCMVAGVELEANSTDHKMSNQQSECQSFPNVTQSWIAAGKLVRSYKFTV